MLYPELDQDQILYEELRRKYFDEWDEQPFGMLFWGGDHGEEDTSLYLAVVEPPQFGHYLDEDLLKRALHVSECVVDRGVGFGVAQHIGVLAGTR
ncbi:hypothetical protein [Corynebacterium falsenii]|uniref:hypothetical protein n=1 Tax=Corynebacterium falsenii TaxID=108486 RepID=UPI001183B542